MLYLRNINFLIIILLIFVKIKYTFQLREDLFGKIVNYNEDALECFRNPNRDICASVKSYMVKLNPTVKERVNTQYAKLIMGAIKEASWNIQKLDFQDGSIDSSIFTLIPPPQVKYILLSHNNAIIPPLTIPNSFINNLKSCPLDNSPIEVKNCTPKLKKLCSSIICISDNENINNSNNNINNPNINNNNNNINDNNNNNFNPNNEINHGPIDNENSNINNNNNNSNNNSVNGNKKNNKNKNINGNGNGNGNGKNNKNDVKNNNNSNDQKTGEIISNIKNVDEINGYEKSNTKALVKTFFLGILTSFSILATVFIVLCAMKKYSHKKKIKNYRQSPNYYENKPLVNSKSISSSYDTVSLNCGLSYSSSQASHSTIMKHKRYLYLFDDGSVMMSKSNSSMNSSLNTPNISTPLSNKTNSLSQSFVTTNSNNIINNSTMPILNSKNSNIPNTSKIESNSSITPPSTSYNQSPTMNTPIILNSAIKTLNRNSSNIPVPPETHTHDRNSY